LEDPDSQKVDLTSTHLTSKVEVWFPCYITVKKNAEWDIMILL